MRWAFLVLLCLPVTGDSQERNQREPTPSPQQPDESARRFGADMMRLLRADKSMLDGELLVQWERLLAEGGLAQGEDPFIETGLYTILRISKDPIVIDRIFCVMRESIGETRRRRGVTIAFIKRVLPNKDLPKTARSRMLISAARTLGFIGRLEDSDALLPLLKHDDWMVLANATRAVARIGNIDIAKKVEEILKERAESLPAEKIEKDLSFREGYKAIADIKYREFLKNRPAKKGS